MSFELTHKVAIVTGAGQGIGSGIARVFAAHGASVVVATRSEGNGLQTTEAIRKAGGEAVFHQVDVGVAGQLATLVEHTVNTYGGLDIVVHNAGVFPFGMIDELSEVDLEHTLAVNLKACFRLARLSVPHLRKRGGGRLLFTSSVTGPRVAEPGLAHYAASKAGINGFIRTAAMEYARCGITVNGVEPGYIMTPAMQVIGTPEELAERKRYIPVGRYGEPDDIAHAMLYLASPKASYVTGQTLVVDGGSTLPESPLSVIGA